MLEISENIEKIKEKNLHNKNNFNTIVNKCNDVTILEQNELLKLAISKLPNNYSFEIPKTIVRINNLYNELVDKKEIKNNNPILVGIQLPDGLSHLSVIISDIIETFSTNCETIIMADQTYGACCIDDIGCKQIGVNLIVHYGHSCLVPINECLLPIMYVFVDIIIDYEDCAKIISENFKKEEKLFLMGSIQFNNSLFLVKKCLIQKGFSNVIISQTKPRSTGEVLGCTSPKIDEISGNVVFICDGRFHMESLMISNPQMTYYQYNPMTKVMSLEMYDIILMKKTRKNLINKCYSGKKVGVVFGTLGRQGNEGILNRIIETLEKIKKKYEVIMLSEITEDNLSNFDDCDYFVQIACPRLSIDWGVHFTKPVITPYEFFVVSGESEFFERYPMDYYSLDGGKWSNYYGKNNKK